MTLRIFIGLLLACTTTGVFAQSEKPITIMPIGDSLTQTEPGFRKPLFEKLQAAGYNVEFVGPKKAEPKPGSTAHAGHGGFTIGPGPSVADGWTNGKGNIYDNVESWLKLQPDLVLLLIGTNEYFNIKDLQPDYKPDRDGPGKLGALLDKIHEVSPKSHILVSSIMPVAWNKTFAKPLNDAIPNLVATRSFTTFVDLNQISAFAEGDWSGDKLHPSDQGYGKMAVGWFDALVPFVSKPRP